MWTACSLWARELAELTRTSIAGPAEGDKSAALPGIERGRPIWAHRGEPE
jgi:hypothetical protein